MRMNKKQMQTGRYAKMISAGAGMALLALGVTGCHSDQPAAITTVPVQTSSSAQTTPGAAQTTQLPPEAQQKLQGMSPADKEKYQKLMEKAQGGAGH